MKVLVSSLTVLSLLASCGKSGLTPEMNSSAIIHGEKSSESFVVSITTPSKKEICSGVLITKKAVLTAAHCVSNKNALQESFVTVGNRTNILTPDETFLEMSAIRIHPGYAKNNSNDLAVVILKDEVPEKFQPIPLNGASKISGIIPVHTFGFSVFTENDAKDFLDYIDGRVPQMEVKNQTNDGFVYLHGKLLVAIDATTDDVDSDRFDKFLIHQQTGGMCSGDSGGPTVITSNGKTILLGINQSIIYKAGGFPSCNREALATSVQKHLPWIKEEVSNHRAGSITVALPTTFPTDDHACASVYGSFMEIIDTEWEKSFDTCKVYKAIDKNLKRHALSAEKSCTSRLSAFYPKFISHTIKKMESACP